MLAHKEFIRNTLAKIAMVQGPNTFNAVEIKALRNKVIGNPFEKIKYINNGTFERLLNSLENINDESVMQYTLIFLSSCLLLPQASITNDQAVKIWILFDKSSNEETRIAAAKCLRSIYESNQFPVTHDNIISIIENLHPDVIGPSFKLSLVLCELLSKICKSKQHQSLVAESGGMDKMVLLLSSDNPKIVSSCLLALSSVLKENSEIAKYVMSLKLTVNNKDTKLVALLLSLCKSMRNHLDKLIVCSCIVNLYAVNVAKELTRDINLVVLPTLVKLLNTEVDYKAALVLAYLTAGSEDLQKSASEAEAIPKLAQVIKEWTEDANDLQILQVESALTALASIASLREDCRKKVIDSKVLNMISRLLDSKVNLIRSAACQLTRSLSRSVKTLRTALVDASIVKSILNLLKDDVDEVKISACATLCNIVLDFSPVKEEVTENGGIEQLVLLISSNNPKLRLNAIWALKNLVYQSKTELKQRVMVLLTYPRLLQLLNDDELIQEHALNLIRNLACMDEKDIEDVFKGIGATQFIQLLESKVRNVNTPVLQQALYVVVNVATGNYQHKSAILASDVLIQALYNYISHEQPSIRVAAVWAIINLTWQEEQESYERTEKLRVYGFQEKLKQHLGDSDADVRGRVKTCLEHFEASMSE